LFSCIFGEAPNELRVDAAEGSEAEEGYNVPPHQTELD
jgi:hypothetical protein